MPNTNPSPATRLLEATRRYVDERFRCLYRRLGEAGAQGMLSATPELIRMDEEMFDALYSPAMPLPGGYTVSHITHGEVTVSRRGPQDIGWTDTVIGINDLDNSLVITEYRFPPAEDESEAIDTPDPYRDENLTLVSRLISTIQTAAQMLAEGPPPQAGSSGQ